MILQNCNSSMDDRKMIDLKQTNQPRKINFQNLFQLRDEYYTQFLLLLLLLLVQWLWFVCVCTVILWLIQKRCFFFDHVGCWFIALVVCVCRLKIEENYSIQFSNEMLIIIIKSNKLVILKLELELYKIFSLFHGICQRISNHSALDFFLFCFVFYIWNHNYCHSLSLPDFKLSNFKFVFGGEPVICCSL